MERGVLVAELLRSDGPHLDEAERWFRDRCQHCGRRMEATGAETPLVCSTCWWARKRTSTSGTGQSPSL